MSYKINEFDNNDTHQLHITIYGVVQMGYGPARWLDLNFSLKVTSRLMPGEGVDLVSEGGKHDFRTFQKELAMIGTKNFANG